MAGRIQWKIVSETIDRRSDEVYDYMINPENFSEWATSFCHSVEKSGRGWLIGTEEGPRTLRFADRNPYGILDHYVGGDGGRERLNPARVIPSGEGSKVIFTVFQVEEDAEDRRLAMDIRDVEQDLRTWKRVLEKRGEADAEPILPSL